MADAEQSLTWRLSDEGMDLLERAGLAGLYMTLRAAREARFDLSPLQWSDADLTSESVTLRWTGPAKPAFVKLMEWAWQVRDGILYLPAIHGERELSQWWLRVPTHNGIMRTFLQHVNTQPKLESVSRLVNYDENKQISVNFEPPADRVDDASREINPKTKRPHKKKVPASTLKASKEIELLFNPQGRFRETEISISNWLVPGIAGRYGEEKSWVGSANRALILMLAPTVCLYQRLQGKGNNWVLSIGDVRDLCDFDETRRQLNLNMDLIDTASLGDAGLKFHAEYSTRNSRSRLAAGCRVIAMGYVDYYEGQSIRKAVLDVPAELTTVKRYKLLNNALPNNYIAFRNEESGPEKTKATSLKPSKAKNSTKVKQVNVLSGPRAAGFIKIAIGRGRIADNLSRGKGWYCDLLVPTQWDFDGLERQRRPGESLLRTFFTSICYQRSKLMKLIQEDDMWDTEAEKVFVQAFWETLDSLYAQEAAAVKRGGARSVDDRFEDMEEDIRRRFMQAKTRTLLRGVLTELFAKAGRQKTVRSHPAVLWRLVDDPKLWHKGRDLALLALASHRNKETRDNNPTSTISKGA